MPTRLKTVTIKIRIPKGLNHTTVQYKTKKCFTIQDLAVKGVLISCAFGLKKL